MWEGSFLISRTLTSHGKDYLFRYAFVSGANAAMTPRKEAHKLSP